MNEPHPVMLLPQKGYQLDELIEHIELIFETFKSDLPKEGKVLLKPNLVKGVKREASAQTDPEFMRAMIIASAKTKLGGHRRR